MEYSITALILIVLAVFYIKIAQKFNIVDNPNFRSSHTIPTIRGGGILFYIAILLFFVSSGYEYKYAFLGISALAIVSFIDDVKPLSAVVRLPFQFIGVALLVVQAGLFELPLAIVLLLLIVGVGFINLYNFMDGINGITGLYSLAVLSGFLLINTTEQLVEPHLIYFSLIALLVFGYYNFRKKARMFAGDIGSITIAMLLLFLGLLFMFKLKSPVLILLVFVYGLDSVLTILYRMHLKEHIMQPHRHHIYQKLVDVKKWSHLKVSGMYAGVQLLVDMLVFVTYKLPFFEQAGLVVLCILLGMLVYVWMFKMLRLTTSST